MAYDEQTPLLKPIHKRPAFEHRATDVKIPKVTVSSIYSEDSDSDESDKHSVVPPKIEDSQTQQSQLHTEFEHGLDFWSALRIYQPAVFWCVVVNVTIVLNGFDGALMGNLVGVHSFKQQFGVAFEDEYIIPASWLGAFNYGELS